MSLQTSPDLDSPTSVWLLLHRLGCPAALLRRLVEQDPTADAASWLAWPMARWREVRLPAIFSESLVSWHQQGSACDAARQAVADLAWLQRNDATLLHFGHADYPPLLLEIPDPPPWLYVLGDVASLSDPQLAVVGSRRPTQTGLGDAEAFAGALAAEGFVITSGLAYGIDGAAHAAAMAAGGRTNAVLGSGIDCVYPARHTDLARRVAVSGAVVSELPLGAPPRAQHFPSRNRIISGLSLGVLVVEAMLRSGSLVTARLALEQGREVFALPGSLHNPASRGCNQLIRQGAVLVQEVTDIVAELRGWMPLTRAPEPAVASPLLAVDEQQVLGAVGFEPTQVEQIAERTAQPIAEVMAALSELELSGLVENRAGAWLRRARS